MKEYKIELSEREREGLEIVLEQALDTFDFHSDLAYMEKPVKKLLKVIKK